VKVRIVFLRGEEAKYEASIERDELETALDMEDSEEFRSPSTD